MSAHSSWIHDDVMFPYPLHTFLSSNLKSLHFPLWTSNLFLPSFKPVLSFILSPLSLFFLLWEQKSSFSLSFIKPIPLIHFSVSSPRIRLRTALTRCWWRARNITWWYVTHFCLISTHSSTKPTPRGRLFYVLSCTSKSFWTFYTYCQLFTTPDQTSNQPFIANIYAVRFGEKRNAAWGSCSSDSVS